MAFDTRSPKKVQSCASLGQERATPKSAAHEIAHLKRELARSETRLRCTRQESEDFAHMVSHDLRGPLNAICCLSQIMQDLYGDRLEAAGRAYLDEIVGCSLHLSQMLAGLLALSRCTSGELRLVQIDLSEMARRLRVELEQAEPQRRVTWRIEPGLKVRGDARLIEVLLRKLLENAWKFTSGVAAPVIRLYGETEREGRFICVADNGAGFDMVHADKLFQPFQRLHRPDQFPGLGLGLATARRIVHRHGGTLQALATPDLGATFRFSLPLGEKRGNPAR